MRLTNRERLMLLAFLLVIFVAGVVYYVYLPVYDELNAEKFSLESNQQVLADIEKNILPLDQQIALINNFREKVEIMKRTLPPVLYQEDIIRRLYETMGNNNVEVIEYSFAKQKIEEPRDHDQEAIDKILSGYEDTLLDNISKNMVEARFEKNELQEEADEQEKDWKTIVDKIGVTISLQGQYELVMKALNEIEDYENLSVITSLSIAKDTSQKNNIVGTVEITFPYYYDNETLERVDWVYKSIFEAHSPFDYIVKGSAADPNRPIESVNSNSTNPITSEVLDIKNVKLDGLYDRQAEENTKLNADFEVVLSAPTSILNGYFVTKSDKKDFSLSSDRDSEEITITLTESQGSVSYAYSTSFASFPKLGEFMSFNPNYQDAIYVSVVSSPRIDSKDVGMCKLNILNKTSRQVKVVVSTDDDNLPRLNMGTREGNVILIRN